MHASLDTPLADGVHRVEIRSDRTAASTYVVAAPTRCYRADVRERAWGVFAPTYALRGGADLGTGHFGDLAHLGAAVATFGGRYVATLPLLPTYLDEPFDPSPYAPVSRRHWNDALLDPAALQEHVALHPTPPGTLVDWHAVGAETRGLLDQAVASLTPARAAELDRFLRAEPDVARYARFRAARDGDRAGAERRYAYGQWQARTQVDAIANHLAQRGAGLLLDFPVGAHPEGYDVWEAPHEYVSGVSVGAPPDDYFTAGQQWGFPPPHPDAGSADGYARLRASLAHHMAPADALRVDHVMGLHRLYWVPDGFDPRDGVYVRYPADTLWALLSESSHRHRCRVIGEDLGTVPRVARRAMARHGALGCWVGEFQLSDAAPTPRPPHRTLASLSTHDTETTTAWMRAAHDPRTLECLLGQLGASRAEIVVTALDDLWGETERQNVPGTSRDAPNWRLRHARSLDELFASSTLTAPLERLAESRRGTG